VSPPLAPGIKAIKLLKMTSQEFRYCTRSSLPKVYGRLHFINAVSSLLLALKYVNILIETNKNTKNAAF